MATITKNTRWLRLSALLLVVMAFMTDLHAITPSEALAKAKSKIESASTVSASFSMKLNGQTVAGTLLAKGNKFALTSGVTSNWYNGTDLYSYVASKNETTVFCPSASELAEVNPLLFIKSASNYKVMGTKTKKAGVETIVLMPKSNGGGIKSVVIELDSKTFLPRNIKVQPTSGATIDLTLSNVKLNAGIADSSFAYPKSKYPKAKIIDMR